MSDINSEVQNKKKGLGRGLGSLLQTHNTHNLSQADILEANPPAQKSAPQPQNTAAQLATPQPQKIATQTAPTSVAKVAQPAPAPVQKSAMTGLATTPPMNPQSAVAPRPVATTSVQTQAPTPAAPPLELASANQDKMWMLSIEKLKSGKYQPRKNFDKQSLDELASSIKEHGILQPLVVRSVGGGHFEIIAGERRWRAAQAAGLHEVPAIIKSFDNQKTLELSLIENLQREDLNPIEEAEGYQRLMTEFNLTQERVAEKVGKERATVANALRLLKLAPEVREMVQKGEISQGHAKVLLGIQDAFQQKELAKMITHEGLSVRKLENLVQKRLTPSKQEAKSEEAPNSVTQRLIAGLAEEMQKLLGTRVSIDYAKSKGKMSIYFYSDDELTQIIEKLRGGAKH